ncbi:MAG: hypothetical protein SPK09_03285 [Porphyromonas sp.]|nr:hypothetical protein [Porphyromonas sp.]
MTKRIMPNAVSQLFGVTRREEPLHSQYYDNLLCPTTGIIEPLHLQLYTEHVNYYGILRSIKRRPVARFFRAEDNKEIAPGHWTADMTEVHRVAVKGNPVKTASNKLTLWGKCVLVLLLALICVASYFIWSATGSIAPVGVSDSIPVLDSLSGVSDSISTSL